jgi:aryl-alcohol dehydrogenase-like predicted oxidoreductase
VVKRLEEIAAKKKCTPAQLALAWVMAQGKDIVPIPGTKRREYLEQNAASISVQLSADDLQLIDEIAPPGFAAGMRYPEQAMKALNR